MEQEIHGLNLVIQRAQKLFSKEDHFCNVNCTLLIKKLHINSVLNLIFNKILTGIYSYKISYEKTQENGITKMIIIII